ncbi:1-deoxy-D-xylulose-5-phosphate reductoisomerase, partial [candidate division KSB1 bacterium]|nr:1-deoxy-D-xylulose-5-phosphate reductoisomerase [candidate division KSB1 bacterium]
MAITQKRRITLLGSTGSIGTNCLEVLKARLDQFQVQYLTAHTNWEKLAQQTFTFRPKAVAITGLAPAPGIQAHFDALATPIYWGLEGLEYIASQADTDLVVNALVGAVGLKPTLRAIEAGKDLALSNKESLVIAGEFVMRRAAEKGVTIIPVDSEHSAIFQCLQGENYQRIEKLILTASGGPFWQNHAVSFREISVAQALQHPNWNMGRKITIDSATLMNKGLEVIEAHWLFHMPPDKIAVVIHPSSIVHSMIEFVDGSIKAQLGVPDMKIPIQYALSYPDRWSNGALPHLDLSQGLVLEFHPPDLNKFRTLGLAFEALRLGGTAPAVLNAANEVAVQLFIDEKIRFDEITRAIESA